MPTKILHAFKSYELFSKGGGVERYIDRLCLHSVAAGYEATVVARVAEPSPSGIYRTVSAPRLSALWREVAKADRVHIHGTRVGYAAIAGAFALLQRKKLFYTAHCFYEGKTPQQTLLKFVWDHTVERALFAWSNATILLSDYWREYARRRGLPVARAVVLPNGVDVAALEQEVVAPLSLAGAPAILSVCRLDPVKRVEDAIAALAQPTLTQAVLHVIGRGADEPRLRAVAAAQGVTERVVWHGFKTDAEIASMARAANVFVIASAEEGMPTTILEMLARRVPVVASDIPGNRSLLEPLHWPHLYPLGDVVQLAQAINAATGKAVPDEIGEALKQRFDWQVISAQLLHYYEAS